MIDTIYGIPVSGTIERPSDIQAAIWRAIAERGATAEHDYQIETRVIPITPETRFRLITPEADDER